MRANTAHSFCMHPSTGEITDPAYSRRVAKFLNELVWMARALRYGRENFPGP
jgi:hypothetical protein